MKIQAFLAVVLVQIYCFHTLQHADASQARISNSSVAETTTNLKKDIQKLENEFTSAYDNFMTLHAKTDHNITNQELKKDLEAFDKRGAETGTRFRRSGACAKICIHRCIPSCNLACCVERPMGMNRHIINKMEVEAAKKLAETGSKKSIVRSNEKLYLSKEDMEKGEKCDKKCLIHCEPSCKFKCCIRVPRG